MDMFSTENVGFACFSSFAERGRNGDGAMVISVEPETMVDVANDCCYVLWHVFPQHRRYFSLSVT